MATPAQTAEEIKGMTLDEATQFLLERYPSFTVYHVQCNSPPKEFEEEPGYAIFPDSSGECVIATHPNWGAWNVDAMVHDYKHENIKIVRDIPDNGTTYSGNFLEFYPDGYFPNIASEEKKQERESKETVKKNVTPVSHSDSIKKYIRSSLSIHDIERAMRLGEDYIDQFYTPVDDYEDRIEFPKYPDDSNDETKICQYYLDCLLLWNDWIVDNMKEKNLIRLFSFIKSLDIFRVNLEDGESYMTFPQGGVFFDRNRTLIIRGTR